MLKKPGKYLPLFLLYGGSSWTFINLSAWLFTVDVVWRSINGLFHGVFLAAAQPAALYVTTVCYFVFFSRRFVVCAREADTRGVRVLILTGLARQVFWPHFQAHQVVQGEVGHGESQFSDNGGLRVLILIVSTRQVFWRHFQTHQVVQGEVEHGEGQFTNNGGLRVLILIISTRQVFWRHFQTHQVV